jgi:hypothetical protein
MRDQKNLIIAIALSVLVLAIWQYLFPSVPQHLEHQKVQKGSCSLSRSPLAGPRTIALRNLM